MCLAAFPGANGGEGDPYAVLQSQDAGLSSSGKLSRDGVGERVVRKRSGVVSDVF